MIKERTTKEIITPNGNKVVIYDYITGGELRKFQALLLSNMDSSKLTNSVNPQEALADIKATTLMEAQELLLDLLVVSVDGETESAGKIVLDLRPEDTNYVISQLDSYTNGTETKKE